MGNNEDALGSIILGVLGLAAVAVLLEKKCPHCNKSQLRAQVYVLIVTRKSDYVFLNFKFY